MISFMPVKFVGIIEQSYCEGHIISTATSTASRIIGFEVTLANLEMFTKQTLIVIYSFEILIDATIFIR